MQDILHAHYASSYGLLGALANFHPFILSIWGADIFSFPKKSFLHRYIFNFNLRVADKILSTSQIMAKEIKKYTNKEIIVTPFGIDINTFKPGNKVDKIKGEFDFIIGTIKGLEEIYGIEYLYIVDTLSPKMRATSLTSKRLSTSFSSNTFPYEFKIVNFGVGGRT